MTPRPLRVLVACEFSGAVRDAFTARGHAAMSCDLLPSETPGLHYRGDVPDRAARTVEAIDFVRLRIRPRAGKTD